MKSWTNCSLNYIIVIYRLLVFLLYHNKSSYHIISTLNIISSTTCFSQRDDDLVAMSVSPLNHEKLAFPECCRPCLQGNSAGTGLAWGEGGITRKSWHMPSTESLPSTA